MGSGGSLSRDVMRCYNPPRRRVLFETFPKRKLGLHFGQNMSILNELIGYVDLTDCRKIWQKHSEDYDKLNGVGKLLYLKYFPLGDHLRNTFRIFLPSPALDVYLDNQSEYRKSLTSFC